VKLIQVNTVLDYKLLRDDLPSVLQRIEHIVDAHMGFALSVFS